MLKGVSTSISSRGDLLEGRSNEKCLKDGDRNTKFFYGSVEKRRVQNTIPALANSSGVEQFSKSSKGKIAVDYFCSLFTSTNTDHARISLPACPPKLQSL